MDCRLTLAIICVAAGPLSALAAEVPEGAFKPPTLQMVFNTNRLDRADVIHFWSGETLRGEVLNQTIALIAPYGNFDIPLRTCAGISFEGTPFNSHTIITVNFNRMTGLVMDPAIRIKLAASGQELAIRKGKIRYVLLRHSESETAFMVDSLRADLFVMSNRDLLTGKSTDP